MQKIDFTKIVASGNDFVLISAGGRRADFAALKSLARNICHRKFGAGADGMLYLDKSKTADLRMRIFNADGSEAEMCGNGARCAAFYYALYAKRTTLNIETKAGIINAQVKGKNVRIKLTDPREIKLDTPIKINRRRMRVNFVNTGVPHVVVFTEGLEKINAASIGRAIRWHRLFQPRGANVNFIEALSSRRLAIRTYERGVEEETLACGTGSVAAALILALKCKTGSRVEARTKSGEILRVYFRREGGGFRDVWLEGGVKIVYKGVYYV